MPGGGGPGRVTVTRPPADIIHPLSLAGVALLALLAAVMFCQSAVECWCQRRTLLSR